MVAWWHDEKQTWRQQQSAPPREGFLQRSRPVSHTAEEGAAHAPPPDTLKLRRQTIATQIHAILRREIIANQLTPHTKLSEQEISQRFAVSRTPVREALIKLVEEKLVEIYPQYGSFVAPIPIGDVLDSQFVREALECAAVEQAASRINAAQAAGLDAILERQRHFAAADDYDGFFAADEQMHALIMQIAGHPNAWRQVELAKTQMDRVRYLSMHLVRKRATVIAEHAAIVAPLARGQGAEAVAAMRVHLRGLFRSVAVLTEANAGYFADAAGAARPGRQSASDRRG
jgi:DNA-binding GntR family transcriptional regulator